MRMMSITCLAQNTALALAALTMTGCVTVGADGPKPSAGFAPKQTYTVPYEKLWSMVQDSLDKNKIAILSADKTSGVIQTDYIAGPATLIAGGLAGSQSTRYKYNITLRNQPDSSVKMNILCKIESTVNSGHGSSQWTDVTNQNPKLEKQGEDWLYELIEKQLGDAK